MKKKSKNKINEKRKYHREKMKKESKAKILRQKNNENNINSK